MFFLELFNQVKNLRLGCDIERGGGFVGNDQFRFKGQSHCDHDPLPLPTGQLVWVAGINPIRIGQMHIVEQLHRARMTFVCCHVGVHQHDLFNLLTNAHQGAQGRHRLLEDHGDAVSTQLAPFIFIKVRDVLTFKMNLSTRYMNMRFGQQPHQCFAQHRFAGA